MLLVNEPAPVPSLVLVDKAIVGFWLVLQQTPLAVIAAPPLREAELEVTFAVISVTVTEPVVTAGGGIVVVVVVEVVVVVDTFVMLKG